MNRKIYFFLIVGCLVAFFVSNECVLAEESNLINGVCGYSHGKTFSSVPTTNLCAQGTPTPSLVDPWGWTCNGINGGSSVNCSANQIEANTDNNITDGRLKLDKPLSQMSRNELFQVLILLIMNLLSKN
jgi:hypothetical protein